MSAADRATPVADDEARLLFDALCHCPALVLAVSGGPDSTALMVLAARWRTTCEHPPRLVAATVDHGLRPESAREAEAVSRLAESLGIEHRTLHWTGPKPATGLQAAAREARYGLLAATAREVGALHLLTGHTLDDQAETMLLRLFSGSGMSGLAGMAFLASVPTKDNKNVLLIRPLLRVPKTRLIATLKAAKVNYADDPTNRDPRFTRARLRLLMPALVHEGLTTERLARLASRIERAEDALFEAVNNAMMIVSPTGWRGDGPLVMDAEAFSELPEELAIRLLARAVARKGTGPAELGKLEALHRALANVWPPGSRFRRTLAGAVVTLAGDRLEVDGAPPRRARKRL